MVRLISLLKTAGPADPLLLDLEERQLDFRGETRWRQKNWGVIFLWPANCMDFVFELPW
jgi:hypothetical protein